MDLTSGIAFTKTRGCSLSRIEGRVMGKTLINKIGATWLPYIHVHVTICA
jgi:hypothetical protein